MFILHRFSLTVLRLLWRLWLWLFFLGCLLVLLLALMFPRLPAYKPEIEQWVSRVLAQPVTIGHITTYWDDGMPTVGLQQVRLLDAYAEQSVVEIAHADIVFNLFASLKQTQIITDSIILSGSQLTLARNRAGSITVVGLPETKSNQNKSNNNSNNNSTFLTWLSQQPQVSLQGTTLTWQEPEQPPLTFYNLNLLITEQNNGLQITGQVDLPQPVSDELQTHTVSFQSWLKDGFHTAGEQIEITGHIRVLSLDQLVDQLPPGLLSTPELSAVVMTLQGTLHDVQWTYAPNAWRVRARFADLTTKTVGQLPGVQGLAGAIDIQPDKGTVHFDQTAVTLTLPSWYNHPLSFAQLTGAINWQRSQQRWRLTTKGLRVIDNKTKMKIQVAGHLDIPLIGGVRDCNFVVTLRDGQLSQLPKYIPEQHLPHIVRQLHDIQLRGHLSNAQILIIGKGEQTHFEITGQFKQARFKLAMPETPVFDKTSMRRTGRAALTSHSKLVVRDLAGQINIQPNKGTLRLKQARVTLNLPNLYSHPLSLTRLKGDLNWQRTQQKWQVTTNNLQAVENNMKIQVRGRVDIPKQGGVPYSDLRVTLRHGQLSQIPRYLPDKKMPKLIDWFNEAQLSGRLNQAHAIIQGPLNAIFDTQQSRFELKADVNHVHLNYAAGWPRLKHLKAEVIMKGQSLTVIVQQGQILNSQLGYSIVEMPDLSAKPVVLSVFGHTHGPAADGLRFIENSPLRDAIDLRRLELAGLIYLTLNLTIPLAKQQPAKVQGSILFKEATLHEKPLDITLTDVAGRLNFTDNSVSTENLRGQLGGNPIHLSLSKTTGSQRTQLQLTGLVEPRWLSEQLTQRQARNPEKNALLSQNWGSITKALATLSGETHWVATLDFPNDKVKGNNAIDVQLETDWLGMDIKLPAPLGKMAHEQRRFRLTVRLGERGKGKGGWDNAERSIAFEKEGVEEILVRVRYGEVVNGVFRLNQTGLERGAIVLGVTPAQLPKRAALTINGHIPHLSITAWLEQFTAEPKTDKRSFASALERDISPFPIPYAPFPLPLLMTLSVGRLELFQQTVTQMTLHAKAAELRWQLGLTGTGVDGEIAFNYTETGPALAFNFRELTLTLPPTQTQTPLKRQKNAPPDPHDLPRLSFQCDALRIDNINLGRVNLHSHPYYDGLKFKLTAPALGLNVDGKWRYVVQRHQTVLQASLNSDNLGALLQQLGYQQPPLIGEQTQITLNAYWQDALYRFKLATVAATLSLVILEGQIVDVEPGTVGRLFGLFDMYTLPRRLLLDFSDVFDKGFGFSIIAGVFAIKKGSAHTRHLILQAPSAQIEISGQTHLIDQSYDQTITVFPHVSSPLPIAGALAGGIGGGVAAWLVEQLLKIGLKSTINFQYHLTGSWQNPTITRQ